MGQNPYLDTEVIPPPKKAYKLHLRNTGEIFEVDPDALPEHHDGQKGSILSILVENGVDIDHACGGVVACSTCHIYVQDGFDTAPEPIEEEEDQLEFAPAVNDTSRLACQCVPDGSADVTVEIPAWNRNKVSEEH
ncbi:MAG: 2Fe-2S iron-sulfur cluster-binding protein [Myxococcota bacterium]|nr:2Fe-2S iron-sulfur cluster-binding protein [Myxococcota bacterium]